MYRILLSVQNKAYAYNLGLDCKDADIEDFSAYVDNGDVIVLASDLEDAKEKLSEWDIEEVFD